MAYDSDRGVAVVVGGFESSLTYLEDIWEFDGSDWSLVTTPFSPIGRKDHSIVYDSALNKIVMTGGQDSTFNALDETWEYDGSSWAQITTSIIPTSREGHAMVYDSIRGKVTMFGGLNSTFAALNETWEYDILVNASVTAFGAGCPAFQPLTASSNLPILGTSWLIDASPIAPVSPCLFWFGDTAISSGIDLSFIAAAGCFSYSNANLGAFIATASSGSGSLAINVPSNPALLNYALTVQASTSSTSTPAGFITSNGIEAVIGY